MLLSKINSVFTVILNLVVAMKIHFVQFFSGMHLKSVNRNTVKEILRRSYEWMHALRHVATDKVDNLQSNGLTSMYMPFEKVPVINKMPVIGHIYDMLTKSQTKLLEDIDKTHRRLGPIYRDHIGPLNVVFVSNAEMMRSVFLYEGKYPRHALPESWLLYNQLHGCERGLFFMEGEEWLKHRKLLNSLMLRGSLSTPLEASIQAADTVINQLMHLTNQESPLIPSEILNLEAILYKWAIDQLIYVILGPKTANESNLQILEPILVEFSHTVQKLFEYSSKLLAISPNLARKLKLTRWIQFEQNVTETLNLAKQLIKISIIEFNSGDGLLAEMQTNNISEEMIQKILVDLIIAAGDTSANTVQWALHLLATNWKIQRDIRHEILQNTDNQYDTPLLRGTIKETLRLFPIAPLIGRFIASDAILGNYHVPKESLVVLSLFTSGRRADHFYDPLDFIPSRWTSNISHEAHCTFKPHGSIPFALGARSCIGRKIAMNSMQVLISKILQNFEIKSNNISEITPIMRMVTVPDQKIRISIKPL